MEAIGTLAAGISHDFNIILAAIIGFAEMAYIELPENSPARLDIQEVLKAGRHLHYFVPNRMRSTLSLPI